QIERRLVAADRNLHHRPLLAPARCHLPDHPLLRLTAVFDSPSSCTARAPQRHPLELMPVQLSITIPGSRIELYLRLLLRRARSATSVPQRFASRRQPDLLSFARPRAAHPP